MKAEVPKAVGRAVGSYRSQFERTQLRSRGPRSLGIRSEELAKALRHEVTVRGRPRTITGRVHFGRRGTRANMIAAVHEFGKVISPKSPRGLVFPVERKYSRGLWRHRRDKVFIRTRKPIRIPARLGMRRTWQAFRQPAKAHVRRGVVLALRRGFRS